MARIPVLEMADRVEQEVLSAVETGQKAVLEGTRGVTEALTEAVPEIPEFPLSDQVPLPSEVVDVFFDFAEKLVVSQRKFTRELLETCEGVVWTRKAPAEVAPVKSA